MGDGQLHTTTLPWVPRTTMLEIQGPKACPKAREQEQVFPSHYAASRPSHLHTIDRKPGKDTRCLPESSDGGRRPVQVGVTESHLSESRSSRPISLLFHGARVFADWTHPGRMGLVALSSGEPRASEGICLPNELRPLPAALCSSTVSAHEPEAGVGFR